jgi:hypothetical protein
MRQVSETERHDPAFSQQDDSLPAEPRAISGLALAALALGLASALALAAPYFWMLPIAGVVLAVVAMVSIAREPEARIGRSAAVAGLTLSVLFGSWGVSNDLTRQQLLYQRSELYAQRWLRLVLDGELYAAHQLKMAQPARRPPGADLAEYYENDSEARIDLRDFCKRPPVADLIRLGPNAVCRLVRNKQLETERDYQGPVDRIVQHFEIESPGDPDQQRSLVQIVMTRIRDSQTGEARWRMESIDPVAGPNR